MSLHEYKCSQAISAGDPPFYALIMAAMRQGDSDNVLRLKMAWPHVWEELQERYNAPGGLLQGEQIDPDVVVEASGDVRWVCAACGERNPIGIDVCRGCDTERRCG